MAETIKGQASPNAHFYHVTPSRSDGASFVKSTGNENEVENGHVVKTKGAAKKTASIVGSHLATARVSITMSNEEAKLMEKLNSDLNHKDLYPSKSEILRAGLWSLRNKKPAEIEEAVKDLLKVKQTRVL
ncbi:8024_t:CDS:2 [Funneliformis geosporum]|nr:8024_t:CDS:2 [Funneliformis geosporum]